MVDHQQIPPEIFSLAFEMGVLSWGTGFLPPLCLVCHYWNDIIVGTPRLWGIIDARKGYRRGLGLQITRAQASPLTVFTDREDLSKSRIANEIARLVSLAPNWIRAYVPTEVLSLCRWRDMISTLEVLTLTSFSVRRDAEGFFGDEESLPRMYPRLRSLTAKSISPAWIKGFLSPSLKFLSLNFSRRNPTIGEILSYLSRTPNLRVLEMNRLITYSNRFVHNYPTVILRHISTIELNFVIYPSIILREISAPSLQTLRIERLPRYRVSSHEELRCLSLFFMKWSQPGFIPTQLHTLHLEECMQISDVAFLIRWLGHLPNLIRLIIIDEAVGEAAKQSSDEEDTSLYNALSGPRGDEERWLCPSLMHLHIDTDLEVRDLIPLARARGGNTPSKVPPPARLRYLYAPLCPSGSTRDIEDLSALIDEVKCECFGCGFNFHLSPFS